MPQVSAGTMMGISGGSFPPNLAHIKMQPYWEG